MVTRSAFRTLIASLGLLLAALYAPPALGQPSADEEQQGKQLAREAFTAYKQGDYATALDRFEQARKVYPTGQVLRMTGYTLLALERWVEAADTLDAALATGYKPVGSDVRGEIEGNRDEALKHVATVTISSEIEGASVSIDGDSPLPLPAELRLLEGTHTFVASAEGHKDDKRTLDLLGGEPAEIDMRPVQLDGPKPRPEPDPAPEPEPEPEPSGPGWFPHQKTIGFVVGGTGLAATVAGIIVLASGSSLRSSTQENIDAHNAAYGEDCSRGDYELCYYDAQLINQDGDKAQDLETAGLVTTIIGGTLLATGVVFLIFAPWGDEAETDPSPAPGQDDAKRRGPKGWVGCGPFGPVGVGCTGRF